MKYLPLLIIFIKISVFADEYIPTPIDGVKMECFKESDPIPWAFCLHTASESSSRDLLYYLHGRNGNETWWNDSTYHTGEFYKFWREYGDEAPVVVSISFGKLWLLTENQDEMHGGLRHVFIEHVMPTVEKKLNFNIKNRLVAGISMGGLNSLILSMKTKNIFTKSVAMCAPLSAVSPHDSPLKIWKYFTESSMSLKRALMMLWFSKNFYPTQEIWEANDPLFLSKKFDPVGAPKQYLTCGQKDDWGCMKGSELFVENIETNGGMIEWVPRAGGHCDIDHSSVAKFIVE